MNEISNSISNKLFRIVIAIIMILTAYTTVVPSLIAEDFKTPLSFSSENDEQETFLPVDIFDEYFSYVEAIPADSNEDNKNDTVRILYDVDTEGIKESVEVYLDVFNSTGDLISTYKDSFLATRTVPWYHYFDYYAKYTDYFNFSLRLYDVTHNKKENYGNNYEIPKIWLSPYKPGYEIYVTAVPFDRDSDGFNDDVRVTVKDIYGLYLQNVAVYIDGSLQGYTNENGSLASTNWQRGYHEVDAFYNKNHANNDFKSEGNGVPEPFLVDCDPMDFEGIGSKNDVMITVIRENSLPVRNADVYIDNNFYGTTRADGTYYAANFDQGFHYVNVKGFQQWIGSVFYAEEVRPSDDYNEFIDYAWAESRSYDNGVVADDIKTTFRIGLEGGDTSNVTVNATLMFLNYTEIEKNSINFTVIADEFEQHTIYFYNQSKDSYRIYLELFDEQWKLEDTWLIEEIPVTHLKMIVNIDRGVYTMDNTGSQNDLFFYTHIAGDSFNDGYLVINRTTNSSLYANVTLDESGYTTFMNIPPGAYAWFCYDTKHNLLEEGDFNIYPSLIISTQTMELLYDDDADGYYDDFRVRAYDDSGNAVNNVYVYIWDEKSNVFKEGYTSALTPGGSGSFLIKNVPEGNYTYQARTTSIPQRHFSNGSFYSYGNNTEAASYLEVFATPSDLDKDGNKNDVVVKVVDLNNDPVPNVQIYYDNDMTYYDTTDSNGEAKAYDFEYGWHHVDAISAVSQPRGHAYTQFFSEGYDFDEYIWYADAYQYDADEDGDYNDLGVYVLVGVNEWVEELEMTAVSYLYYEDNGTYYGKSSTEIIIYNDYDDMGIIYFYDLPYNTTFNTTIRLYDQNGKLEDEWEVYDIYIKQPRDEINVELGYFANWYYDYDTEEGVPAISFIAHKEEFGVKNVTIYIYYYSNDTLAYTLITDSWGYAQIEGEDFDYTLYYWKAYNETDVLIEDESFFRAHQNITFYGIVDDYDEDGYWDDFYFRDYWSEYTTEGDMLYYDSDNIDTTVNFFDANKQLIKSVQTEDEGYARIINLTEGYYYVKMSYEGVTYDYDEFFIYGNGFENQEPSALITTPINNSEYTDADTISFDGSGSSDPDDYDRLTYDWRSDIDGFLSDAAAFTTKLSIGKHNVTLTVDDAHDHIDTTSIILNVVSFAQPNAAPRAVISSPIENQKFYKNDAIYFDGANSTDEVPANLTFIWSNETMILDNNQNRSQFSQVLSPGGHKITLFVEDSAGLNSTDIVNITVENRAPTANISSPEDSAVYNASDNILFDGAGSSDPDGDSLSYLWESNITGEIGTESSISAKLSGGMHQINLTVSDDEFNDTASVTITVINTPPAANITSPVEDWTYFKGAQFFDGSSSLDPDGDVLYYYWELDSSPFMGNVSSFTKNVTELGLHTVVLYVTDGQVNVSATVNFSIENQAPVADAGPDIHVNMHDTVEFNASNSYDPDGDLITFIWDFDKTDGTSQIDAEGAVVTHKYSMAGEFEVTLKVSDGSIQNNTATDNLTVYVNSPPEADAGPSSITRTAGTIIYFNASLSSDPDGDALTYSWNFGDGTTGAGMNVSHTYDTAGTYTVTLNVTDGLAWDIDTLTAKIITPNAAPVAMAGPDVTVNINEPVTFNGSDSSDFDGDTLTFTWDFGDGNSALGPIVTHTYTKSGIFLVVLTVEDGKGGSDSDNLTVTINSPPTARIVEEVTEAYVGEEISLDASDSTDPENHFLNYYWDWGDGKDTTGKTVKHIYATAGTYTITLRVEDDPYGAYDTYSYEIEIKPIPAPVITIPKKFEDVTGVIDIEGTATGDVVEQVELYIIAQGETEGVLIDTVSVVNGKWSTTWDTNAVDNGAWDLQAISTADEGKYSSGPSSNIRINIENEVSDQDDTPEPKKEEPSGGLFNFSQYSALEVGACLILIIIIIVIIIALIVRSGGRRKRAPAEALRAAQMDAYRMAGGAGLDFESATGAAEEPSFEEITEEEEAKEEGTKRPVKCPSCGEIFLSKDKGERPWMLFCTQCGAKGLIKEDTQPKLPPGKDKEKEIRKERAREKIKCPECSEIFSVYADEKEIECPNCGITGEK